MLDRLKKLLSPTPVPAPRPEWDRPWNLAEAERQGEPMLRQRLEQGDIRAWPLLSALLTDQGRMDDLVRARDELAARTTEQQLRELVHQSSRLSDNERLDAAEFQLAMVTRFPAGSDELGKCASRMAEAGRLDEAVTYLRESIRLAGPRVSFFQHPMWTIKVLTAAGRYDDAEELLRGYPYDDYAISALALMMQVRGRTTEGEQLLHQHMTTGPAVPGQPLPASREVIRLTLFTLLERAGRTDEAAGLRPAHGWSHERGGPASRNTWTGSWPTPEQDRHQTIWSVVDDWGRGTAV
ncbi:tetratricopeptide repeat protein [Actinoplanes derwentensis]|uniref:Tetratricopeptide repeat-containing protein n=1 Tax=Actinoplanes derwentensis TaxID=113562 RepID=A0A1H2CAC3_9ACTN|nr:tetratricopeptide repeat protein [Actinoplanes derwentensis]GID89074.1 hypothetical protein Ade03nite_79980 [Actinoplanes derwentensis]SDT67259.1 hypothetical protein SAMN04489716_5449 [Actinoplanes derwentensis]